MAMGGWDAGESSDRIVGHSYKAQIGPAAAVSS